MSDNTRGPHPVVRRHSQVYVDVPLPAALKQAGSSSPSEQSLKENTPLRPSRTNSQLVAVTMQHDKSSSKKRKMPDDDMLDDHSEPPSTKSKKPKVATAPQPARKAKSAANDKGKQPTISPAEIPSEEYPNGYFYCHQCNRKRDRSEGVLCTFKNPKAKVAGERCRMRYCKACLKNRYEEDMDAIKSRDVAELSKKQKEKHVLTDGYYFQCPKCRDDCNCRFCRKAKGLEPTGNLNLKARQAEKAAAAAAEAKAKDNKAGPSTPKQRKPAAKKAKNAEPEQSRAPKTAPKTKAKAAPKPKPLPKPLWTRVATDLAFDDAEIRFHIREFSLRFASALQLAHSHLDELEELSGENLGPGGGWDVEVDSDVEVISWVSELCAKSIVQGLLDILAAAAESRGAHGEAQALHEAEKAVKNSGANLNRVWVALLSLRDALGRKSDLAFADPLPPPASTTVRTTRRGLQAKDSQSIHIANSAQLVPVIADLIESAMESPAIREALDSGATDEKELSKNVREAITNENARWKNLSETKDKARREQHNKLLRDLEFSHRIASTRHLPRFAPLGEDLDGRVYYALAPSVGESEAANQLIHGKDTRVKIGRKRVFTEDDRREMQRWSWFIAVWGKKPEGADEATQEEADEDERRDDDEEAWWGFWQPAEISKLAEWIAIKSGVAAEGEDGATTANGTTKGKQTAGRGRTSSSSSRLTSLASSREISPLSDLSDDEDGDVYMKTDADGNRVPVKSELAHLAEKLREYAELLEWRIQRVSGEGSS